MEGPDITNIEESWALMPAGSLIEPNSHQAESLLLSLRPRPQGVTCRGAELGG